jgi:hypothetical protein
MYIYELSIFVVGKAGKEKKKDRGVPAQLDESRVVFHSLTNHFCGLF